MLLHFSNVMQFFFIFKAFLMIYLNAIKYIRLRIPCRLILLFAYFNTKAWRLISCVLLDFLAQSAGAVEYTAVR